MWKIECKELSHLKKYFIFEKVELPSAVSLCKYLTWQKLGWTLTEEQRLDAVSPVGGTDPVM